MTGEADDEQRSMFPKNFRYIIIQRNSETQQYTLRAEMKEAEEAELWIRELEKITLTRWIVKRNYPNPQRMVFHKSWSCHLSHKNKSSNPISKSSKKVGCNASVDIKIKNITPKTKQKDEYLKLETPLNAVININLRHDHNENSASNPLLLRPSEKTVKDFDEYFDNGLTPAQAIQLHESKVLLMEDPFIKIANATINPTKRWVYAQYKKWREHHLGDHINFLEKIKEKEPALLNKGTSVYVEELEDQWAVLVVTPVMKRAQELHYAKEIIFIDSSGSCDSTSSTVTIVLTATKAGAVPLGILIHKNQTFEGYKFAFECLKKHYLNCFGGENAPSLFMTDDSAAEKSALKACWPESLHILCHFHVAQAEWRWLLSTKNKIPAERRRILMSLFQKIMYADTEENLEEAVDHLSNCPEKNFVSRVENYLNRREEWVMLYRLDKLNRGSNTNNYAEASIRVIKDVVLGRLKAFNVVALVDFCAIVFEEYLSRRIYHTALGNCSGNNKAYDGLVRKIPDEILPQVKKIDEFSFSIPSVSDGSLKYTVDIPTGTCDCFYGKCGRFCKHQAFIHKHFGGLFPNAPVLTCEDRYTLSRLALGNKCPEPSFFSKLKETQDPQREIWANSAVAKNDESRATVPITGEILNNAESINIDNVNNIEFEEQEKHFAENILKICSLTGRSETSLKCLKSINSALGKITTGNAANEALINISTALKRQHRRKIIRVQPTSISRRRPGVTRGSKRIAAGRPPTGVPTKRRRVRNLAYNISKNVANSR